EPGGIMKPSPREQAEALRQLHAGPRMLVLPNAWDVATARLVEEAGFPAIATTSAGIACTLGYADGERISRGEMLAAIRRITAAVRRANGYLAAGADCLFVPHVSDGETIGRLARELSGPLNVIAGPPAPPLPELERLGVRRASLGPRLVQATLGLVRRLAAE